MNELDLPYNIGFNHVKTAYAHWIHWKRFKLKSQYFDKNKKIILLVRNPKDVTVSYYFQTTKREEIFKGTISQFIRNDHMGIKKNLSFYQECSPYIKSHENLLIIKYEDLVTDTYTELKRILKFLEIVKSEDSIHQLIKFVQFDNMQKLEKEGHFSNKFGSTLTPNNPLDKNSYKVPRGKIGGYKDYLSLDDIAYCDKMMEEMRNPFY